MNATDLNAMTVKALNVIARDLGMKRYSALRKAALIAAIVEHTYQAEREAEIAAIEVESTPNVKILDTENVADHAEIVKIMAQAAPVKAPESVATATDDATEDEPTTEELIEAYGRMRATRHTLTGLPHARLTVKLAALKRELKNRKVNTREV